MFLSLLLDLIADETPEVSATGLDVINAAGVSWSAFHNRSEIKLKERVTSRDSPAILQLYQSTPADFAFVTAQKTSPAGHALVAAHFSDIIRCLRPHLSHWLPMTRARGAQTLAALSAFGRVADCSHLSQIICSYSLLLSDEDNDVRCGARAAARALGASSDNPEPLFDSFLSLSRTMRSIPKRAGLMRVVSAVIGAS